ncbi:MAG: hypothetical protein MHM6MM_002167 [Cercozoa sp. M6MM]
MLLLLSILVALASKQARSHSAGSPGCFANQATIEEATSAMTWVRKGEDAGGFVVLVGSDGEKVKITLQAPETENVHAFVIDVVKYEEGVSVTTSEAQAGSFTLGDRQSFGTGVCARPTSQVTHSQPVRESSVSATWSPPQTQAVTRFVARAIAYGTDFAMHLAVSEPFDPATLVSSGAEADEKDSEQQTVDDRTNDAFAQKFMVFCAESQL